MSIAPGHQVRFSRLPGLLPHKYRGEDPECLGPHQKTSSGGRFGPDSRSW